MSVDLALFCRSSRLPRRREEEDPRLEEEKEQIWKILNFDALWCCLCEFVCVLQVAGKSPPVRGERKVTTAGLPDLLFTGGAWNHAPPVTVAREQTRHQPPLHCHHCPELDCLLLCNFLFVFLCLFVFELYF